MAPDAAQAPAPVEPPLLVAPSAEAPAAPAQATAAVDLPDWLKDMAATPAAAEAPAPVEPAVVAPSAEVPVVPASATPADELPDWLKAITQHAPEPEVPEAPAAPVAAPTMAVPTSADELPDWLKALTQDQAGAASMPVAPSAVDQIAPSAPPPTPSAATPLAAMTEPSDDLPDWLRAITQSSAAAAAAATTDEPAVESPAETLAEAPVAVFDATTEATTTLVPGPALSATPAEAAAPVTDYETPAAAPAAPAEPMAPPPTRASVTLPPWLVGVGTAPLPPVEELPELDDETLAWLSESKQAETAPEPAGLDLAGAKLPAEKPAWLDELAAATPAVPAAATPAAEPAQLEIAPTPVEEMPEWLRTMRGQVAEETLATEDMPDWLRALRGLPPTGQPATTASPATGPVAGQPAPALAPEPVNNYKLPATESPAATIPAGPAAPAGPLPSELEQAALPAWLSAMRPVDVEQPAAAEADSYEETLGVLAGMRGVLRAEPVVAQPHKAAAQAPALTISDTNTTESNLLTELLRTEDLVKPVRRGRVRWGALVERWVVFLVLLAAIVLTQFQAQLGLPALFNAPAPALPPESAAVYQIIEQLPKDKPALVAFDYDASQSGELDPGAAAVVHHLATRGVPVVAVSLRLTGAGAAEHVLSQSAGSGYVNLGYISGGPVGLLQFAVAPRSAFVSDFSGNTKVWQTLPLATVNSLSDFGLIVLVSGAPESTRAWIEQAQPYAGDAKTVAVISAGAEPMVRPYYDDPNANSLIGGHLPLKGLIVGLGGAAAYERATYAPAAATALWPALGGGLLAAAIIILLGSLLVLIVALVPRRRKA